MFEFFGVFEADSDGALHVVIFVVDWEFDFFLAFADLVELLVFLGLKLYIDFDRAGQSSEEGTDLFLNISMITMNNKDFYYINSDSKIPHLHNPYSSER